MKNFIIVLIAALGFGCQAATPVPALYRPVFSSQFAASPYTGVGGGSNIFIASGASITNPFINGVSMTWPSGHGTPGQVLSDNGSGVLSWINPAGGGTVTSVGLSTPSIFTVSGSPVTGSGTLTFVVANQSANLVWASPTSGPAAPPTFRALVSADMPAGIGTVTSVALSVPAQFNISGSPITTSGTLALTMANENANLVWAGPTTGAATTPTFRSLVSADLPAGVGSVTSVGLTNSQNFFQVSPTAITASGIFDFTLTNSIGVTNLPFNIGAFPDAIASGATLYWSFGDSHTSGDMAGALGTNWQSGSQMIAKYRYPNILAAKYGLSLTNAAVSGSSMRHDTAGVPQTPISQIGQKLPLNWTGIVSGLIGYNDGLSIFDSQWPRFWWDGQKAFIGRALIDSYTGVGASGLGSGGAAPFASFSTTGTAESEAFATSDAFPTNTIGTDLPTWTKLTGSQFYTITVTNWTGAVLFFENYDQGGAFWVATNTIVAGASSAAVPFGNTNRIIGAIVLKGLSGTTTISATNISGTNRIYAVGRLPAPSLSRVVVMGTPNKLTSAIRSDNVLSDIARATVRAAYDFLEYPVYLADVQNSIDVTVDVLSADPNHPTPLGQIAMGQAFDNAKRLSDQNATFSWSQPAATKIHSSFIGMLQATGPNLEYDLVPGAEVGLSGGNGYFQSYDRGSSGYLPSRYAASSHKFLVGGIQALGSTRLTYDSGPSVSLSLDSLGTYGLLQAYDFGALTNLELTINASGINIDTGMQVTSAFGTGGTKPLPGLVFGYSGGAGGIQSYNYNTSAYIPMLLHGSDIDVISAVTRHSGGGIQVLGNVDSSLAATGPSLGLSLFSGRAFVQGYDYGSSQYSPLVLRGTNITIAANGTEDVIFKTGGRITFNGTELTWPGTNSVGQQALVNNGSGVLSYLDVAGSGTVTSVGATAPTSLFTVSGSPITTAGTFAFALTQTTSNKFWAGPIAAGALANPTFRVLDVTDFNGGLNADSSHAWFGDGTWKVPSGGASDNWVASGTTNSILAGIGFPYAIQAQDGSLSAPSFSFTNWTLGGMSYTATGGSQVRVSVDLNDFLNLKTNIVSVVVGGTTTISSTPTLITLNANTVPASDLTYNLGGGSFRWQDFRAGDIGLSGMTYTTSGNILFDTAITWNGSGQTMTGWKLNVTDTASAAGSLLEDLEVGGTSMWSVKKDGSLTVGSIPMARVSGGTQYGIAYYDTTTSMGSTAAGTTTTLLHGNASGTPTFSAVATADISNDAVTYAKIQNVSAASKLLGRGSASGSGDVEEITLGSGLTMTGTTLSASGGGSVTLDTVLADAASATIDNGANTNTWQWALTGATQRGFTITESTAATNGETNQFLLNLKAIAASTATPLNITLTEDATAILPHISLNQGKGSIYYGQSHIGVGTLAINLALNGTTQLSVDNDYTHVEQLEIAGIKYTFPNVATAGILHADGADPSVVTFSAVALGGSDISGTLGTANGGTGTASAGTQYGLPYYTTTTAMASTAAGTTTTLLHGNASGAPSFGAVATADISNDAVTYAKIQNVSAASKLLGRGSASGSGDVEEITIGSGLSMSGTTLSASGSSVTLDAVLADAASSQIVNGAFTNSWLYTDPGAANTSFIIKGTNSTASTTFGLVGQMTSATAKFFNVTETLASTGGSGSQYLANFETLASSTATPWRVATRGTEVIRASGTATQLLGANGSVTAPTYSFANKTTGGLSADSSGVYLGNNKAQFSGTVGSATMGYDLGTATGFQSSSTLGSRMFDIGGNLIYFGSNSLFQVTVSSYLQGKVGIGVAPDATRPLAIEMDALGVTPNAGIILSNVTAASSGNQQVSPGFQWQGQGWSTSGSGASVPVEFRAHVLPVQASIATGNWILASSVSNAAFSTVLTVSSGGTITANSGGFSSAATSAYISTASGGLVRAGNSGAFQFGTTRSQIQSPLDKTIQLVDSAGTSIASIQASTTNVVKTANYTVVQLDSGIWFNNSGASGTAIFTLPAATVGYHFWFVVVTAQTLEALAVGSDTIRDAGSVGAAAGNIQSATVGNVIHLFCPVAGQWFCDDKVGSWTLN